MGIMDFIKGELIDLIEWTDDSRDTLSFRYPDEDKAIKNGAQSFGATGIDELAHDITRAIAEWT